MVTRFRNQYKILKFEDFTINWKKIKCFWRLYCLCKFKWTCLRIVSKISNKCTCQKRIITVNYIASFLLLLLDNLIGAIKRNKSKLDISQLIIIGKWNKCFTKIILPYNVAIVFLPKTNSSNLTTQTFYFLTLHNWTPWAGLKAIDLNALTASKLHQIAVNNGKLVFETSS